MKTIQLLILIVISFIGFQKVYSQHYKLDTKKSTLSWTGKAAFRSYSLKGTIAPKEGVISVINNSISSLHIIINMKSIDHENEDLKSHLKNEDFFEVKTYPKAIFSIDELSTIDNTKTLLKGKLTIKKRTNAETITTTIAKTDDIITLRFNHSIDRTKYGVNHNSPSIFKRMKENAIADEFILEGTLVFIQ